MKVTFRCWRESCKHVIGGFIKSIDVGESSYLMPLWVINNPINTAAAQHQMRHCIHGVKINKSENKMHSTTTTGNWNSSVNNSLPLLIAEHISFMFHVKSNEAKFSIIETKYQHLMFACRVGGWQYWILLQIRNFLSDD